MSFGSENYYPLHAPDYLPDEELQALAAQNQAQAEINYLDEVSVLRARIIEKMFPVSRQSDRYFWAVFIADSSCQVDDEPHGGLDMLEPNPKRVMIVVNNTPRHYIPTFPLAVRILTNQEFDVDSGTMCITEDVTIDGSGAAQLCVDGVHYQADQIERDGTLDDVLGVPLSPAGNRMPSQAPIFIFNDEQMSTSIVPKTPILRLTNRHKERTISSTPFGESGMKAALVDRYYALARAQELVTLIEPLQPTVLGG